jgi:hypothetical protein
MSYAHLQTTALPPNHHLFSAFEVLMATSNRIIVIATNLQGAFSDRMAKDWLIDSQPQFLEALGTETACPNVYI